MRQSLIVEPEGPGGTSAEERSLTYYVSRHTAYVTCCAADIHLALPELNLCLADMPSPW